MKATYHEATTINQVIDQLDLIIKDSIKNGSRIGYFAALYKRVTVTVKTKISESYFEDNDRMEKLDVIFANRYLKAYHQRKNKETLSKSWQVAFDACDQWRPLVIQHLFIGMNAHIGLDLGIAAAQVQPDNINDLKPDFDKINVILGELTEVVQDELSEIYPIMKTLDRIAGGADEKIAGFAMGIARDAAWDVALNYSALSNSEHAAYIEDRDKSVAEFGRKINSPGKWINFLIVIARLFERGNIASKIAVLNKE